MPFGSHARGDTRNESDHDIAVFLRDIDDRLKQMHRPADLSTAILCDTGEFIHAMPYRAGFYNDPREPLMYEIRPEGIDV